ncbi:hypothetical protein [Streptomyces beigongshangae]|uniref:hypothetical protein n=1 Tax=Streptomyces beigongshangae TaxID=2841597 RepID=UPI001C862849|nr:hypothetical protein [Streptomyces sp. REN17]
MRTASALIGARIEQCAPCLESLTAKLLDEAPIVLAVTAETESSDAAKDLAGELHGQLSTAYSAIGHVAYKEQPAKQQSPTGS